MVNIFGLILFVAGFMAPSLSGGRVPYDFFFWLGFVLLLRPNKYFPQGTGWLKYARIGVLAHVLGTLIILIYNNLVVSTSLSNSHLAYISLSGINYIVNPVSSLFRLIFPGRHFTLPDGSIVFITSYTRGTITGFLNVLLYVCVGAIIGKLRPTRSGKSEERKGRASPFDTARG